MKWRCMRAVIVCWVSYMVVGCANVEQQPPGIELKVEAPVLDGLRDRAIRAYNDFLSRTDIPPLTTPVAVNYATSNKGYEKRLREAGYAKPASARRQTEGVNVACKQIEMIVVPGMQEHDFNEIVWREMSRSLQCEWSQGSQAKAPAWLNQSAANFYALMLLRKAGQARPFEEWVNQRLQAEDDEDLNPNNDPDDGSITASNNQNNDLDYETKKRREPGLRDARYVIAASQIATPEGWEKMGERHLKTANKMADLMMVNLYIRLGEKIFPALRDYYMCLPSQSHTACFEKNMGLSYAQFLTQIDPWVATVLNGKQEVKVASADAASGYVQMQRVLDVLVPMMDNALAGERPSEYKLVPSINSDEKVTVDKNQARVNLSLIPDDVALCRVLTQLWMLRYVDKTEAKKSELYWMYVGIERWLHEQLMDQMGVQSLAQSQAIRTKTLAKAKMQAVLQSMQTRDDWVTAAQVEKEKPQAMDVLEQAAAMAVYALVDKYGIEKVKAWSLADQAAHGKDFTFAQVFGLQPDAFLKAQMQQMRTLKQ